MSYSMYNSELIKRLTDATQDLKALYIDRTRKYAVNNFIRTKKKAEQPIEKWYEAYGVKTVVKHSQNGIILRDGQEPYGSAPVETYISNANYDKQYYKMKNAREAAISVVKSGVKFNVERALRMAEHHYEDSIARLAFRLTQKGLVPGADFDLTSGHVGLNFECNIHFDMIEGKYTKHVKAWTILAWGEIIRPHYRYLVK